MYRRFGSTGFWTSLGTLALIAGTLPWVLRQGERPQTPLTPQARPTPGTFTHTEAMPITTGEQLQALEERLKERGFETCCYKDGPTMSGHSLVGSFESVDFRIYVMRSPPGTINVSLEARAPFRKPAESASSNLTAHLLQ